MRLLDPEEINITREAEYIVGRAECNDARVVTLRQLVLFSTQTGDAWMLDTEDGLALCLARMGERQPYRILETPADFTIEWQAHYRIEGDLFMVIEQTGEQTGRLRSILGYPTGEIRQAIERAR